VRTPTPLISLAIAALLGCSKQVPPEGENTTTWYVDALDDGATGAGTTADPFRLLQTAIDSAESGDTIVLEEGTHRAEAYDDIDPTCGNCDDSDFRTDIEITVGFKIEGKGLHLVGASREGTILETGAGYGLYFIEADSSSVQSLTLTGGIRDADGQATDAAIVAKYTALTVSDVDIVENNDLYEGEPDPVVGVIGIAGREGAVLTVTNSRILNTSWDGIALYRGDPEVADSGPDATIIDNEIGCTEECVFYANGRGVGIGITWDASAEVINNHVHDFWKGIGTFGTSEAVVRNNIVEDNYGWGIIISSNSTMVAENNLVIGNGNVGMAAWDSAASGRISNNLVTENGNVDEWVAKQTGVWMNSDDVELSYNDIWNNAVADVCSGGYPGGSDCIAVEFDGLNGNLSLEPLVDTANDYVLESASPLLDAGDPDLLDADGSRSDIGLHGGPDAGKTQP